MYAMLFGILPFSSEESIEDLFEKIKNDKINFISEDSHISEHAIDLLNKMLVKIPEKRITIEYALNHPFLR